MKASDSPQILLGGKDIRLRSPEPIRPPLVSLIIRNWNYARFIGTAIDSVKNQDYPHIEAFVVDNASDDDSREVIERHVDKDPRFTIINNDKNLGPLGGVLPALKKVSGDFVCFVDSDDYLMSNFVSIHIQTHLAVPRNVAFTTNNVFEIDAEGNVLSGSRAILARKWADSRKGLRPKDIVPRLSTVSESDFANLHSLTTSLVPSDRGWFWAPGTANMYRRFIVDLAHPVSEPDLLSHMATDAHYARLAHLFGGSAIIDMPLSAYRIHGENLFSSSSSMGWLRNGAGPAAKHFKMRRNEALRILFHDPSNVSWMLGSTKRYWESIDTLCEADGTSRQETLTEPEVKQMFRDYMPKLVDAFGQRIASREIATRFSRKDLQFILSRPDLPNSLKRKVSLRKLLLSLKIGKSKKK